MEIAAENRLSKTHLESLENKGVSFIGEMGTLYFWHSAGFHYSIKVKE